MHAVARRLASSARRSASTHSAPLQNMPAVAHARCLHVRRPLPYDVDGGMGRFLTPAGLRTVAVDYQQGLLDRLNDQIKDNSHVNKTVAQIVLDTALSTDEGLTFNYASEALNNDFFLQCLKPPAHGQPNHEDAVITSSLGLVIDSQYGTLEQLKSAFSAAAMGMFSSGWVWCVFDSQGNLGVIATYGAGTLLVAGREQRFEQSLSYVLGGKYVVGSAVKADGEHTYAGALDAHFPDPHAPLTGISTSSPTSGATRTPTPISPSSPARTLHTTALRSIGRAPQRPHSINNAHKRDTGMTALVENTDRSVITDYSRLGEALYPLFCVSVHEHAWMSSKYGVWGKEQYLKNFWSVLNWERARDTFSRYAPESIRKSFRVSNSSLGW